MGPHFPEVLQEIVERGAKEIITIPYFLHGGMHILLDIPQMMQTEAEKYPQVKLILGKNLGFDALLVDLVGKRIRESRDLTDVRDIKLPPRDRHPVPEGQCEFVPMKPEQAQKYRRDHDDDHHHH